MACYRLAKCNQPNISTGVVTSTSPSGLALNSMLANAAANNKVFYGNFVPVTTSSGVVYESGCWTVILITFLSCGGAFTVNDLGTGSFVANNCTTCSSTMNDPIPCYQMSACSATGLIPVINEGIPLIFKGITCGGERFTIDPYILGKIWYIPSPATSHPPKSYHILEFERLPCGNSSDPRNTILNPVGCIQIDLINCTTNAISPNFYNPKAITGNPSLNPPLLPATQLNCCQDCGGPGYELSVCKENGTFETFYIQNTTVLTGFPSDDPPYSNPSASHWFTGTFIYFGATGEIIVRGCMLLRFNTGSCDYIPLGNVTMVGSTYLGGPPVFDDVNETCSCLLPIPCWLLTECSDDSPVAEYIVNNQDLSAIEGKVIKGVVLSGGSPTPEIDPLSCWKVTKLPPCWE